MEKDDELKGEGNSYDFGARMLDPKIGRWFAVDKMRMKAPDWSPYRFGFDNPNLYKDSDGKFEIIIHAEITEEAAKINKLTNNERISLKMGVEYADYYGFALDYHFDGRKNFQEIESTWKDIHERINSRGNDYFGLGYDVHNVEDFYSHSNYVELYVQYYKDQGGDMSKFSVDKVPLYEESLQNKAFKKNYLKPYLKTGDFDLVDNEKMPWTNKEELGKGTHYNMNKDSNEAIHGKEKVTGTDITYHELAKGVATNAASKILSDKKKRK